MRPDLSRPIAVHIVGVAGAGMSAIAAVLQMMGHSVSGSDLKQWGLGLVQEIDAAAMSMWVNYKNYDPSFSGPGVAGAFDDLDNISVVTAGALISF